MKIISLKHETYTKKFALAFFLITFIAIVYYIPITNIGNNIEKSPDIILITLESTRANHLPCYGYERNTTPNICELAEDGVLFMEAWPEAPITAQSLPSLLTSKYPNIHSVTSLDQQTPRNIETLFDVINEEYYSAFVTDYMAVDKIFHNLAEKNIELVSFYKNHNLGYNDSEIYKNFLEKESDFLKSNSNSNKFMWIHTFDPHYPYNPPKEYEVFFKKKNLQYNESLAEKMKDIEKIDKKIEKINNQEIDVTEDFFEYQRSMYDSELKLVDEKIFGKLVEFLKKENLYDNSLIIVTSDHSECIGHEDCGRRIAHMRDTVPLIIKFPDNIFSGRVVERPVSHVHVLNTIYDYIELEDNTNTYGNSLLDAIRGEEKDYQIAQTVEDDFWYIKKGNYKLKMSNNTRYNYCNKRNKIEGELYNMETDPNEKNNLINKNEEIAENLFNRLCDIFIEGIKTNKKVYNESLSDMREERLKNLGYLD